MALIKCPNCGEEISDKAEKCVHCGAELPKPEPEPEVLICEECGTILNDTDEICPRCGCPVTRPSAANEEEEEAKPQKVEVTNVNLSVNRKMRRILIGIAAAVIVIVMAVFGIQAVMTRLDQQEYEESLSAYQEDLETAVYTMLVGASAAESQANLIHDVWYNTIYEKDSSTTDEYTKDSNGDFYDDFNTALFLLMLSTDYMETDILIEENQETVQVLMKELMNPPDEYAEAYAALKEYYDAYVELTNLALDPSGSLSSYTSSLNEADSNVSNCYQAMLLYLED